VPTESLSDRQLAELAAVENRLLERFRDRLIVNHDLDRTLVSAQANRSEHVDRWFKYREGFSAPLMRYLLQRLEVTQGRLLDPFAGSGTAVFAASAAGLDTTGIELLPSSIEILEVRKLVHDAPSSSWAARLQAFCQARSWEQPGPVRPISHLPISAGAYAADVEHALGRFLYETEQTDDPRLARVLRFAALCVLEAISYTRKDGQYLRWDYRATRPRRGHFDKGTILSFSQAITLKLQEMVADLVRISDTGAVPQRGQIDIRAGSALQIVPRFAQGTFDALITSPPYCNRYDYTRTYALELAFLGVNAARLKQLRQEMLSCTVENRSKTGLDRQFSSDGYHLARRAFESQECLQGILQYLDQARRRKTLNNSGIPRMVHNYFLELTILFADCARILKAGSPCVIVNDNVRYHGAHVPVDLILSDLAEKVGFTAEAIWVLPKGKGNSSQQMAAHGRSELRKSVYVWRANRAPEP
jgi:DNA modification methylase